MTADKLKWTFQPARTLSDYCESWDRTNTTCGDLPFLRSGFIRSLLAEFGTGNELLVFGRDAGRIMAAGIIVRKAPGVWQTYQPSQLPVGAWLLAPGQDLSTVLRQLVDSLPGFALTVGITQQDPNLLPRPAESPRLRTLDYIETAWVDVEGSFDAYWAARGKNLRHNLRKQRSKLDADGVVTLLDVLCSPKDVAQAIRDYGALESLGWKAAGGTAIHPENAQGRFYVDMLSAMCQQGSGRIYRYRFGDRIVAVDLCVENDATLIILKTTYDESINTSSPAFLMREEAFRILFYENKIKRIEFYGKKMDWHARWTSNVRTLYHVNYYRWPWLPTIRQWATRLRRRPTQPTPLAETGAVTGSVD